MVIFIGRQPIFDGNKNVVSYELLFRNSLENSFKTYDGDMATLNVLKNTFHLMGIEAVTNGKKAFINFTEAVLKKDVFFNIPSKNLVVEILETVEPTEEIIEACSRLKSKGFSIALDDFVFHEKYRPLLEFADIVKVDFKVTKGTERKKVIENTSEYKIKLLAEKIETQEEYNEAMELGYSYFQGYFLCKPQIIVGYKLMDLEHDKSEFDVDIIN